MSRSVIIDCFPESALRCRERYAVVVVDVIRATTTAITAVATGRRVFPVRTSDDAFVLASRLDNPILVGELGGNMPYGFDLTNSPVAIAMRTDVDRPMILVSSSGTQLLLNSVGSEAVYIASFRNLSAVARHVAGKHERVALLGAGSRGEFRREDQMGCAWVAEKLLAAGYTPDTEETAGFVARWHGKKPEEARHGRSAAYLRETGQEHDLDFVVNHLDDLDVVPSLVNGELVNASGTLGKPAFLTE
jgi:2-phosphosulfolactate phosphatase